MISSTGYIIARLSQQRSVALCGSSVRVGAKTPPGLGKMVVGGKLNISGQPIMWFLILTMAIHLGLGTEIPSIPPLLETTPKPPNPSRLLNPRRLSGRIHCDPSDITAEYETRAIIRCRLTRPDTLRLQVWKYPIDTELWDETSPNKTLSLNAAIPPGGVLVYDSIGEQNGIVNDWGSPGGPTNTKIYSMRGTFPKQHLIIRKTTPLTQGVYLWVRGPPDLPYTHGVLTRLRMVREPTLRLSSQPTMVGEPTNATCRAEYYPERPVEFVWLKNGAPIPGASEHIQFSTDEDKNVAISTIKFVVNMDGPDPPLLTCQLLWQNESRVLMSRETSEPVPTLPRPTINITFTGEVAICAANCVPDNVSLTWIIDDDILPPEHYFVTTQTCAHHQPLKNLLSELPIIHMSQRYVCRLSGYPSSISAPEYHTSRPVDTNDTITKQLLLVLKIVGGTIGFFGLLILFLVVCTRACL
ncbi:glycoprotein C [Macropodid alphaherpesvirus 2]|uniref:Envelope glycoprotein C n=1 Tax=Macropodid alphaherpesvirus 2 TaxID=83440 RepID=A0AAE7MLM6_9ALPH|nr:glycoprotein C [Macropodid alphaherpesvirus 2]QOD40221.1 glycoprotein C [Macropodid alphaherpesvirus 2]WGO49721.1 glycoprotein C [Macropodid alphaherpesvirus 2]